MRRRFTSDCRRSPAVTQTLPPKDTASGHIEPESVAHRLRIVAEGPDALELYKNGSTGSEMHPMLAEAVWTWERARCRRTHQQSLRSALASQVGDDGTSPASSRKRKAWSPETTERVVAVKKQRALQRHGFQDADAAPFGCPMPGGPPGSPVPDEALDALNIEEVLDELEETDNNQVDTTGFLTEPPLSATKKAERFKRGSGSAACPGDEAAAMQKKAPHTFLQEETSESEDTSDEA